jgi:hypothetical protein
MAMSIFDLHSRVLTDYRGFVRSFFTSGFAASGFAASDLVNGFHL